MKHIGLVIGAGLVLVVSVLLVSAWSPAPLVDRNALLEQALKYDARVIRDGFGAPHIYGKRDADVAFGLGYAHAEDDWKTIETVLLLSKGKLALRDGPKAAPTDYLIRLFGVVETVDAKYDEQLSMETRALLDGYAAGLNLYAAEHMDEVNAHALPVSGKDVVAGFTFRAPFFFGLEDVLKSLSREEPDELALAPAVRQAFHLKNGADFGSNAIAVSPHRSADGHTRLLINSHQPYTGPVAWYEAHVTSGEGWDASGALFPGSPVLLVGHNNKLGWAHTVNKPDLIDIYRLDVDDPDDPHRYRMDGQWHDLQRRSGDIAVRLFGAFSWTFKEPILYSAHGPVLVTPNGVFAIAFSGQGEIGAVEQWYRMNKAQNLDEWMSAMSMMAVPSLNTVYGDAQGNIAFVYNARIPQRQEGFDYRNILPGDDSKLLWQGVMPFEAVPRIVNPTSGYLINANATPLRASHPTDDLKLSNIPSTLAVETHLTNRARRALSLFGNDMSISEQAFLQYKFDKTYAPQSNIGRFVAYILEQDLSHDPLLQDAQTLLEQWDHTAQKDSDIAALAILSGLKAAPGFQFKGWKMDPVDALRRTAEDLMAHHGSLRVPWGKVNRLYRGDQDVGLGGGPDTLRAIYGGDMLEQDGTLHANAGDSFIMLVDWDADGVVGSKAIHQFGSATIDDSSPHFGDQMPLFASESLRDVPLQQEALLGRATRDYRPGR